MAVPITNEAWQWQRSATKTGVYSDIPASEGGTSNPYTPSEGDLGMWLKAKVTYDVASYTGRNAAGTALQPVLSQPVVSNSGYYHYLFLTYGLSYDSVLETQRYAQGFTTGPDTSGYLLTAVRLSLDSDGNAAGTWAVHADDAGKPAAAPLAAASPILNTDVDSAIDTFEEFTHPGGVRLQPDTKYWIVISQTSGQDRSQTGGRNDYILVGGFGGWSYILPAQHSSDTPYVDPGSEDGWSIDEALGYHILEELESANPYPTLSPWTTLADAVELSTEIVVRMALLVAPEVTAQFTQDSYTVDEGGTQTVTVELSADPERTVTIPITATGEGGATSTDFSIPAGVTFNRGETSKTFTFTATQDTVDDDDESVKLEFGTMPDAWVSAGTRDETTVSITDDDDPFVTVTYGRSSYTVAEGGTQSVTVTLSADPERTVEIPLTTTDRGGAGSADYSGVPSMVTFDSGETSRSFNFAATQDTVDDDDESVKLGFGTMPDARVSAGSTDEAIVSITDDDDPEVTVQYGQATQGVGEGETVNVSVSLSADPERTVTIPVTATGQDGATSADYSVPSSVTFNAGEVLKTIAFTAANDAADDDDESVKLGFGTGLPTRVTLGTRTETTLDIGDDDDPTVTVAFASATYTAAEGGTQTVTVNVSADPERTIIIPVTATLQGTASAADYSGVPPSVTFNDGDTSASFTFTATQALIDDDDEGLKLGFGAMPDPRVSAGTTDETTLSITDDDTADIVLSPASLTVAEQAFSGAGYTVALDTEPTVDVTVTITGQEDTDLTLSGPDLNNGALTFTAANWDTPQTVTIMADHDDDTDGDTGTLTHTGGGGEYDGLDNGLTVRTNDNTGDLRLVDGTLTDANGNLCEGRLEIYYDGAWGTICDDNWNGQEADVACRALGFVASVEDADRYRAAYFGPGSEDQEIVLDDLNCRGDESGLLECPSNHPAPRVHNCKHKEDVGLRCLKPGQSPPWIIDIEFGEPPGGNGSYDGGETLEVTLVWSEPVTISTPSGGLPPKVWVAYGTHLGKAEYASGSGTDRTVFSHTLKAGSHSLVRVTYNTLQERDGSIVGAASGQGAVLGHSSYSSGQFGNQAEAATIIGAPVFNDPGPDNAWRAGESVEVTLIFSQPVQVDATGGAPSLPVLLSGTAERQAPYRRGSGSRQLVFGYTLTADDGAHSSLLVEPNSLALNGGAIRDAANNLGAAIGHEGGGAIFARQAQDETAPQLESATVDGSSLTLAFDEDLDNSNTLPSSLFGVNVNQASRSVMGVAVDQASVTLLLASAVAAGDTVTVDYTVPTDESAARLQDRSGNAQNPLAARP